jgi:ATP-dependent RNA circularization protein (DNA/RNA ligase family)
MLKPAGGILRSDKLVDDATRKHLLSLPVTVEEKVDGANVGLWFDSNNTMQLQNRGELIGKQAHPQFDPFKAWAAARHYRFKEVLGKIYILFGEWCYARHTVFYDRLPDFFLGFDIFDRDTNCFLAVPQRNAFLESLQVAGVPHIYSGILNSMDNLQDLTGSSALGPEPMEGVYIRLDNPTCLSKRAKYVRECFLQSDDLHWSKRRLETNRLKRAENKVPILSESRQ